MAGNWGYDGSMLVASPRANTGSSRSVVKSAPLKDGNMNEGGEASLYPVIALM